MLKWVISIIRCRGRHRCMMHFLGESKTWECLRCGRFFNIPESLTRPGGAFAAEAQGHSQVSLRGAADTPEIAGKFRDMNQFKTRKKGA
jgi:hypothetical protein